MVSLAAAGSEPLGLTPVIPKKQLTYIESRYTILIMICSFKSRVAEDIFNGEKSRFARKLPVELHEKVQRLFDQLNAATKVETLRVPPSNRLERLKGSLKNYWSIRVNKQWRVIFEWENGDAHNVDVVDYH